MLAFILEEIELKQKSTMIYLQEKEMTANNPLPIMPPKRRHVGSGKDGGNNSATKI